MKRRLTELTPQFVAYIPDRLAEGNLYISERYRTAVHLCCCGCGEEVVTPLTPVDWRLRQESNQVSLQPSIGNWNFACKSHYWIRRNRVEWAATLNAKQIERVQQRDRRDRALYIEAVNAEKQATGEASDLPAHQLQSPGKEGLLRRIWRIFGTGQKRS